MILTMIGCGNGAPDDVPDLVPVSGKVTMDGKPLSDAQVEFEFKGEEGGLSLGKTDSKGNYSLQFGSGTHSGAKVGEHLVRIKTANSYVDEQGNDVKIEETVPEKYNWNSELTVTVTEEKSSGYDFELTSE